MAPLTAANQTTPVRAPPSCSRQSLVSCCWPVIVAPSTEDVMATGVQYGPSTSGHADLHLPTHAQFAPQRCGWPASHPPYAILCIVVPAPHPAVCASSLPPPPHAPPPACQLAHSMNCRCDSGVSSQPFGPNDLRLVGSTFCGQAMPAPPGPSGYGQASGRSTDRPPAPGGESEEPDSDEYWWRAAPQAPATGGRDLFPRSESCFRQVKGLLQRRGRSCVSPL